jgi:hypothetical protein
MSDLIRSQELADQIARNLRCSGVNGAYVLETIAHEIIIPSHQEKKL